MVFTKGPIDSQNLRPKHTDARFELTGVGNYSGKPCSIFYKGLTFGTGANGAVGGVYPARGSNLDGMFIAIKDLSGDSKAGAAAGRITRGTKFHDFAADAEAKVYMVWSSDAGVVSGHENVYDPASDSDWDPGAYHSESMTGLVCSGVEAWFNLSHVQEADLSGYTEGVELTVLKGRFTIAASGDNVIAKVIHKPNTKSVLIEVTTATPYRKA